MARLTLFNRIHYFFARKKEPYASLTRIMGFSPIQLPYYQLALRHRSSKEIDQQQSNNERLEFLGDAVLSSVMADLLYCRFPKKHEGELTSIRSRLVQRATLDPLAIKIGLDKLVVTNTQITQHYASSHINGNALEALIGAIYLDRGYNYCIRFVRHIIDRYQVDLNTIATNDRNYKSQLLEWAQRSKYKLDFATEMLSFDKASNTYQFKTQVLIDNRVIGEGTGSNKKESQQTASKAALNTIKKRHIKPKQITHTSLNENQLSPK